MNCFWDSSAVITAAVSPAVYRRLTRDNHFARLHVLLETFSTLTGRGIKQNDTQGNPVVIRFDPDDAAQWLRAFVARLTLVEVPQADLLLGLDQAQSRNIQGAHVYDYVHALAADQVKAEVIFTRNPDDFVGLTKARIEWP